MSIGIGNGIFIFNGISIGIGLLNSLERFLTMLDNSIVNETSPEQTDRRTDGKDHKLSQTDALTKN